MSIEMIGSPLASVKKSGGGVLVAVYIPPSSASNVYSSYRDAAEEVLSSIDHNTVVVKAGDFNPVISIPSIDWDKHNWFYTFSCFPNPD